MQHRENHNQPLQMHHHVAAASKSQQQSQQPQQPPKALRFVTNYGAPHPKRRRIGAACLTCRKRKTACSGERPTCETCKQNKLECAGYSNENSASASTSKPRTPEQNTSKPSDPEPEEDGRAFQSSLSPDAPTLIQHVGKDPPRPDSAGHSPRTVAAEAKPVATKFEALPQESLFSGPRNRMPYFRWLGPTAIMPGFKQMVVKVKRQDTSDRGRNSTGEDSGRSPSSNNLQTTDVRGPHVYSATPAAVESDLRTPLHLPFYDTSPVPPSELTTHLANTFFTHLGCNYPFLQRERFLRDLEEKKVDAILVDAVCALAARFSTHELLTRFAHNGDVKASPAEYGHAFAQRAKIALTDTFPCPTVAAAQAALLLAYNEFGEQKDSGLWMYLGIAIRLAQDLGMHKLEGLQYAGRSGPTPKIVKRQAQRRSGSESSVRQSMGSAENSGPPVVEPGKTSTSGGTDDIDEQQAVEHERVDTFWAIFFLDRVVSSGTGRRSTLRDKDIEISFPSDKQSADESRWPAPFPALIRIVHLYGLVADLLNSIKEPSDITPETPRRLANMERQVTDFYQGLSPRLHFGAVNFQYYMKAGEGTNFVLLHFWFHTLIILLHQPTLLKTFAGPMLRLFPNSQQLAMSSAKTIADILSYSQLMDIKASLGNPFTTQPIYIAACAFLKETAEQSASSSAHSRATSPGHEREQPESTSYPSISSYQTMRKESVSGLPSSQFPSPNAKRMSVCAVDPKSSMSRHTLLATAANQHYQLCYKALQSLETYWAGAKYILTVLDQKFEGVGDPLLYTTEEGESSIEEPKPVPAFTSPGWRRQLGWGSSILTTAIENITSPFWNAKTAPESPRGGHPSKAIGWTLTGTMDSSSTNLAYHYASGAQSSSTGPRLNPKNQLGPRKPPLQGQNIQLDATPVNSRRATDPEEMAPLSAPTFAVQQSSMPPADAPTPLAVSTAYNAASTPYTMAPPYQHHYQQHLPPNSYDSFRDSNGTGIPNMQQPFSASFPYMAGQNFPQMNFFPGDMMIESQDVEMSMLGLDGLPWFDPFSNPEMMNLFDPGANHSGVPGDESDA